MFARRHFRSLAALLCFSFLLAGCSSSEEDGAKQLVYVYSWGDYLDPETLVQFEEETGIHVVLDEFDSNESMFPRVASGAVHYDVLCPSDYMIQKMRESQMLQPLNLALLPNAREYIGKQFYQQAEAFDPGNRYAVPYCWGTVGIIYNTEMVEEPVDSWSAVWDERHKNDILMQDSSRDAFMVALKLLGYSCNTKNREELAEAQRLLIEQKPLVQAYVVDEAKDKMVSGEAAMAVMFSGEALLMMEENPDLEFVVPKEGTNLWMDAWIIPQNAENVENAHKFIDFMCRPDIAVINFDHLGYSTPNIAVQELEEDEDYRSSPVAFPPPEVYEGQETYQYLGDAMERLYTDLWIQVKVY